MKFLVFLIGCFFSIQAFAGLDEFTISTKDKTCSIHYLTTKTKYNWTIKVDEKTCKDGWVNGLSEVQIYSPTHQLTETLSGFFAQGYWLGDFPTPNQIIERTSPEEGVQSLSFLLGKDEEADITYIGQLNASHPENRSYGPFQGCPDFKVLVIPPNEKAFENHAFQDKIIQQGLKYASSFCQKPEILALFGAKEMTAPDIFFKMQVNCATKDRIIIPVKKKETFPVNIPTELKKEKTDLLLTVKPGNQSPHVLYMPQIKRLPNEVIQKKKMALTDLQILSKTSENNVNGRTIVHIKKVLLDGSAITDLPEEIILLYHPNLNIGWAIVEGTLKDNKMTISYIQFCQKEWCTDVS